MLRAQNSPQFICQPCVPVVYDLTKWLKLGSPITPTPCSITQYIWWPNSGRPLTYGSHVILKGKSRDSEMSEMCRAKWKWVCGESQGPRGHRTFTSRPCVSTPKALGMPVFLDFYYHFPKQAYWLNHCPLVTILSLSALSFPRDAENSNLKSHC